MDCLVKVLEKVGMESLLLDVPFVCKSWYYKATLNPSCWQSLIFPDKECMAVSPWDVSECPNFQNLMDRFVSSPCDIEFTSKFIGQQTHEPRADWQVEKFGDLSKGTIHGRAALSIVKLVPNIKYLNLKGAKVNGDGLVTLLHECKDLVMLDPKDCFGFDENDDEISKLVSHISKFMCEGFEFPEFLHGMDNFVLPVDGCSFHLHVEEMRDEMPNDLHNAFNDLGDEE
ncbi:unnamed protein product [Prunus armeniaca]